MTDQTGQNRYGRRALLKGTAQTAGLVGAGAVAGAAGVGVLAGAGSRLAAAGGVSKAQRSSPGELDEYYVFHSGVIRGEVQIVGCTVMRELMRIPVFNRCSATGWGMTNESRKILTEGLTEKAVSF